MARNMVLTYLHKLDPGIPIEPSTILDVNIVILPIDFNIFQDGYCTTNQVTINHH